MTGCACALKLADARKRARPFAAGEIAGGASDNGGFALRGGAPAPELDLLDPAPLLGG